jgi:hypothetical protein
MSVALDNKYASWKLILKAFVCVYIYIYIYIGMNSDNILSISSLKIEVTNNINLLIVNNALFSKHKFSKIAYHHCRLYNC